MNSGQHVHRTTAPEKRHSVQSVQCAGLYAASFGCRFSIGCSAWSFSCPDQMFWPQHQNLPPPQHHVCRLLFCSARAHPATKEFWRDQHGTPWKSADGCHDIRKVHFARFTSLMLACPAGSPLMLSFGQTTMGRSILRLQFCTVHNSPALLYSCPPPSLRVSAHDQMDKGSPLHPTF